MYYFIFTFFFVNLKLMLSTIC